MVRWWKNIRNNTHYKVPPLENTLYGISISNIFMDISSKQVVSSSQVGKSGRLLKATELLAEHKK